MPDTSDPGSLHHALDVVALQAEQASPHDAVHRVLGHVLHRIDRGIQDAQTKGATPTMLAYLMDFRTAVEARSHDLANAVAADPGQGADISNSRHADPGTPEQQPGPDPRAQDVHANDEHDDNGADEHDDNGQPKSRRGRKT